MEFWLLMFSCDLLIPLIMIVCGRWMWKHCPKTINEYVGYRTFRSMKTPETWKYAHEHCGKFWWKVGWILLLLSIPPFIPLYGKSENTISIFGLILMFLQTIFLIWSIFSTEKALKNKFHEDGTIR